MKIQIIVNPAAGGGKGKRVFPHLLAQIKDLYPSSNGFLSRNPQEALTISQQALREGCDCLVVGGGDGTVHSVLPALVNHPAALGVIPLGGANDLARNWNIPLDFREALGVQGPINMGYAAALAFILAMLIFFFTFLQRRFIERETEMY